TSGNSGRRFVCPVGAGMGNLGLDGLDALLLVRSLGHGKGLCIPTCEIGATIDDAIGAGDLRRQPQVNPEVKMPRWFLGINNLALEVDMPPATSILAETARFHDAPNGAREPQAEAMPAV